MTTLTRDDILKANWQNYPIETAIYPSVIDIKETGPAKWDVTAFFEKPGTPYHRELSWDHVAAIVYEILCSQIGKTLIMYIEGGVFPLALAERHSIYPRRAGSIDDFKLVARIERTKEKWYHFHFRFCDREDEELIYAEHDFHTKIRR